MTNPNLYFLLQTQLSHSTPHIRFKPASIQGMIYRKNDNRRREKGKSVRSQDRSSRAFLSFKNDIK